MGSDESISALVKEVIVSPTAEHNWEHRLRLAAANALIYIGTEKAIEAVIGLSQHDCWDVRLLGIMALLRTPKPDIVDGFKNIKNNISQCWRDSRGEMLEFLCHLGSGILYTRTPNNTSFESFSIQPVIDKIISDLPRAELIICVRDLLKVGIETKFACRILGDIGTTEDLPYLHKYLNNPEMHEIIINTMQRIQDR